MRLAPRCAEIRAEDRLAISHLRLPEEVRGHGSPQFPHKAYGPLTLVGNVVRKTEKCIRKGSSVLLLPRTHEQQDVAVKNLLVDVALTGLRLLGGRGLGLPMKERG